MKPLDGEMSITQNLFDVVTKLWPAVNYPRSSHILEIGSGVGTAHWVAAGYDITTVEHDPKWVGSCEGAHYVHAPLVDAYYQADKIIGLLESRYNIWIIDGPPGIISDRTKILGLIDEKKFDEEGLWPSVIIIDDCQREDGQRIADNLWAHHRGCAVFEVHNTKLGGPRHVARILIP